jgi:hypothetical protein
VVAAEASAVELAVAAAELEPAQAAVPVVAAAELEPAQAVVPVVAVVESEPAQAVVPVVAAAELEPAQAVVPVATSVESLKDNYQGYPSLLSHDKHYIPKLYRSVLPVMNGKLNMYLIPAYGPR